MKKMLRVSDYLLLAIGGLLDLHDEIKDPFGMMQNYYKNTLGVAHSRYTRVNIKHAVWRNLRTGNIEKIVKDGKAYLSITEAGKNKVKKNFPFISLARQKWDKMWRIVLYDINEVNRMQRDALRYKLKNLCFGQLQKSVWISPHDFLGDFKEFVEEKRLTKSVFLIETKHFHATDIEELVEKVWNLEKIADMYNDLYEDIQAYEEINRNLAKPRDRRKLLHKIRKGYLRVLVIDPFLPQEILPSYWKGKEVRNKIRKFKIFR